MRKALPALVVVLALVAAGCGSDHESADHGAGMGSMPMDSMPMGDMPMDPGDMPAGSMPVDRGDMPMDPGDMPDDMPMDPGDMPMGDMPGPGHDDHEDSPVPEGARTIEVSATSYAFDPDTITVRVGEPIAVELTSTDIEHDLVVDEVDLHVAAEGGDTQVGGFTAEEAGEYEVYCSVPGHREAGMVGTLVVEEG